MTTTPDKKVTFIQSAAPSMKAGQYTLTVTQQVTASGPNPGKGDFASDKKVFAVKGERFTLAASEIYGVFPPPLTNGELDGVLPQVVFNTLTLPWERSIETPGANLPVDQVTYSPWLAVLTFNDGEQPAVQKMKVSDLVQKGKPITVSGSDETGTGALPDGYLSYPGFDGLDYSESPDEECGVIDLPIALWSAVAPSVDAQYYLGHIREVDTMNSEDSEVVGTVKYAVILGSRIAKLGTPCHAYLVSLEKMSDFLPADDGTPSAKVNDFTHVRLLTYKNWQYTANDLDQSFSKLLENLSQIAGTTCSSGLRIPSDQAPPSDSDVTAALAQQASGDPLSDQSAGVLVQNALNQGYVPLNHQLRHGGKTVSWYRGPLAPYHAVSDFDVPISGPDAANRYNPQTGMFDVSYGAAWQLGQLVALQNRRFAQLVYEWKKNIRDKDALDAEAAFLNQQLHAVSGLKSFVQAAQPPPDPVLPPYAADWLSGLRLLMGVPFNYLVCHESMLPPESIRFFYLDLSWVDALTDGALSIGRSITAENLPDSESRAVQTALTTAQQGMRKLRGQPPPPTQHVNTSEIVTGFLLRSAVVSGWPRIEANAYNNVAGDPSQEIPKLRMERIGTNVLIALFDGDAKMVAIHEVPEALHCGFEPAKTEDQCAPGVVLTTTLRALSGDTPGKQYLTDPVQGHSPNACIPFRGSDQQTIGIPAAVTSIKQKLSNDFSQDVSTFTSAEFALQIIKGVSKVEFYNPPPKSNPVWKQQCPQKVQ